MTTDENTTEHAPIETEYVEDNYELEYRIGDRPVGFRDIIAHMASQGYWYGGTIWLERRIIDAPPDGIEYHVFQRFTVNRELDAVAWNRASRVSDDVPTERPTPFASDKG